MTTKFKLPSVDQKNIIDIEKRIQLAQTLSKHFFSLMCDTDVADWEQKDAELTLKKPFFFQSDGKLSVDGSSVRRGSSWDEQIDPCQRNQLLFFKWRFDNTNPINGSRYHECVLPSPKEQRIQLQTFCFCCSCKVPRVVQQHTSMCRW